MKFFVLLILLVFISAKLPGTTEYEAGILYKPDGTWTIIDGELQEDVQYVAHAFYTPGLETQGWDLLQISTNKIFNDHLQAEAAGRLEGHLTKNRIFAHHNNMVGSLGVIKEKVAEFLLEQMDYIEAAYKKNSSDPHIFLAHLEYTQFLGLIDQYNSEMEAEKQLKKEDFLQMTAFGDIFDIEPKFNRPDFNKMSLKEIEEYLELHDHCSAIYKTAADLSDIMFGHNSWFVYSMMTRIFKEYNFNFNHPSVKAKTVMFSSYPATLSSNDDFYITSQDLSVMETTNFMLNSDLFDLVKPETIPCWIRVMTANRMSETAEEWGEHFKEYNSGTYNNQYMTLDMKKIDLEKKIIQEKAFFITEQLPDYVAIDDVTEQLRYGYWPSYNTPYDKTVKKMSLIQEAIEKNPELVHRADYDLCARATIFRRDQGDVNNMDDFKRLLRYNNYKNDPFTLNSPVDTISSRGDLATSCSGAYDAKVSSVKSLKGSKKSIFIISGPTYQDIDPFVWSKSENCKKFPREGLKDEAKYDWIEVTNRFDF